MNRPSAAEILGPTGLFAQALPGYESRPAQVELARLITEAFDAQGAAGVVAEAGTGIGKSFAYLLPAILSGKKTLATTTNKVLQAQIVKTDLPRLREILAQMGIDFSFVVAKGRGNYECLHQSARLLNEEAMGVLDLGAKTPDMVAALGAEWERFKAWRQTTEEGDVEEMQPLLAPALKEQVTVSGEDCLGKACPLFNECWVTKKKAQAETANVVVANYHVVLLDAVLRDLSDDQAAVLPDGLQALVLDEAHGTEDVATSVLGDEVSLSAWGQIERRLKRLTEDAVNKAGRQARREGEDLPRAAEGWPREATDWRMKAQVVEQALVEWTATLEDRMARLPRGARQMVLGDERAMVGALLERASDFAEEMRQGTPSWLGGADAQAWQKLAGGVERFAKAVARVTDPANPDVARYVEAEVGRNGRSRLKAYAKPISVAEDLRRLLWDRYPTVSAVSATLATGAGAEAFSPWMERVGFPAERPVKHLVAQSPFPYRENALLYVPEVPQGLDRNEGAATRWLAAQMGQLLQASGGGAFLLFTSYRQMAAVAEILRPVLPAHWRSFVQGEVSRDFVIEEFRDASRTRTEPAVLFATKSYFEGVDVRGENLRLVVMDKLPFPNISDPVFQARAARIDKTSTGYADSSFAKLSLPAMITTLKQGTGRLIRSHTDRGVVAILDDRLATKGYGKRILQALPPMARTRALDDVRDFYGRG